MKRPSETSPLPPLLKGDENHPPLVLLVGPTAVGKPETAIQLAEILKGEIVSADSRLFYRGMDIGTAKPSPEEQSRVPHYLIDIAEPDEILSLAVFQQKAREAIADIHARGKLPRAAKLGKVSVQLMAGQYDPAIATLKELSQQKDGALPTEALLMELARPTDYGR